MNTFISYLACGLAGVLAVAGLAGNIRAIQRWAFAASLLGLGLEILFAGFSAEATLPDDIALWQNRSLIVASIIPGVLLLFGLSYARGNAGGFRSRWHWLAIVCMVGPPAAVWAFRGDLIALVSMLDEGHPWVIILGNAGLGLHYYFLLSCIPIAMSFERTYRASVGTMRWRIKYMIMGMCLILLERLFTSSQAILFNSITPSMVLVKSLALLLGCLLILRTLLRTGHFELELYPSHAVLRNSITAFIIGVYLVAVGLFAKLATAYGGEAAFSIKALGVVVSLVLLVMLLQSDRFRLRVRQFVSRHFQRPIYDYRTVWKRFTEEVSTHMTRTQSCEALVKLIAETFSSLSVSIWLTNDDESTLSLKASTSIRISGPGDETLGNVDLSQASRVFVENPRPYNLEKSKAAWARALAQSNSSQFDKGGGLYCVPLLSGTRLLGLIVLGDRHAGESLSDQEKDMLVSVAFHSASVLQNIQLSERLYNAKELEAFQTMAAFFVHDLKNAASTLNIMVKNLPVHWENPEFRKDALRGITRTGEQISDLIGRMGQLRQEIRVDPTVAELGAFAESVLSAWEPDSGIAMIREFERPLSVAIDRKQLGKVLLNLLLNAAEAIEGEGTIRVGSKVEGNWAVLTVEDTGSGISPDFLRKSLFRPFQTTKKRGLGIGMFQSKMIVEAHGGKIAVESKQGEGTLFSVFLPLRGNEETTR